MPDTDVAVVDPSTLDKRTKAYKEWAASQKAELDSAKKGEDADVIAACESRVMNIDCCECSTIRPPEEFVFACLTRSPQTVNEFSNQPNPARALADAVAVLYSAYLMLQSEAYAKKYAESLPPEKARLMPKPGFLDEMYKTAIGK